MDTHTLDRRNKQQHPAMSFTGFHFFTPEEKQQYTALCQVKEEYWTEKDRARYEYLVQLSARFDKAYWAGKYSSEITTH